jgi:predicted nucleic acid-binding protein
MTARYLFDTDTLSLYFQQHPILIQRILRHLHDEIAVTAVTIEEVLTGWYTALRRARKLEQVVTAYDRLTATMRELRSWDIVSFGAAAMTRYEHLRALRLNVRKQDVRIGKSLRSDEDGDDSIAAIQIRFRHDDDGMRIRSPRSAM